VDNNLSDTGSCSLSVVSRFRYVSQLQVNSLSLVGAGLICDNIPGLVGRQVCSRFLLVNSKSTTSVVENLSHKYVLWWVDRVGTPDLIESWICHLICVFLCIIRVHRDYIIIRNDYIFADLKEKTGTLFVYQICKTQYF